MRILSTFWIALALTCSGRVAMAAPVVFATVVQAEKVGTTVHVTVASGSNDGVSKTSTCAFVDAKHEVVSTDCVVIRIDKRQTVCKTTMAMTAATETMQVRLINKPAER